MPVAKKPTVARLIQYWHPRHGGWYTAILLSLGRKWAKLEHPVSYRRFRVPAVDLREANDVEYVD